MKKIYVLEFRDNDHLWGSCQINGFFAFSKKNDAHKYLVELGYEQHPYLDKDQYVLRDGINRFGLFRVEYAYIRGLELDSDELSGL
jgi:hypothetical protein